MFRQSGSIRTKVVVLMDKAVVFRRKWLYSGKVVLFGQKLLYAGKSCCIRDKVVVFR